VHIRLRSRYGATGISTFIKENHMFFNKPPGRGLFGFGQLFPQQSNNSGFDILSSPLFQPRQTMPQSSNFIEGEWDWQKKKPPVVDLLTGLANMFGTPKNQPEFGIPQPDIGFSLPTTTTPPIIAQAPQDKGGWNDWMSNWNLRRSDLGDLPDYPQANDPFALGKQTGDMIRKTWHDVHKDYAFNTIQESFPSFGAPQPQPNESYHEYFDRVGQKVQETNPYQLATMQRLAPAKKPVDQNLKNTTTNTLRGKQPSPDAEDFFNQNLPYVLQTEGGYSNHPADKGKETYKGISSEFYPLWLQRPDIKREDWPDKPTDLSDDQRRTIYRNEFFYDRNLDKVQNPDARYVLFDTNVNSGPNDAERISAEVVKEMAPNTDLGKGSAIGPMHRGALEQLERDGRMDEYLEKFADKRQELMNEQSEDEQSAFGRGWSNRIDDLRPSNPNNKLPSKRKKE
jgi:lysozyme family protein